MIQIYSVISNIKLAIAIVLTLLISCNTFAVQKVDKENFIALNIGTLEFDIAPNNPFTNNSDELFIVSGPLFYKNGIMIGGFIKDGIWQKNKVTPSVRGQQNFSKYNGFIGKMNDGRLFLKKYNDFDKNNISKVAWAIQNGPILVKNGTNLHPSYSSHNYFRAGIGYKNNDVYFLFSKEKITLHQFANMFLSMNIKNALYLDGKNVGYYRRFFTEEQNAKPQKVEDFFGNLIIHADKIYIRTTIDNIKAPKK